MGTTSWVVVERRSCPKSSSYLFWRRPPRQPFSSRRGLAKGDHASSVASARALDLTGEVMEAALRPRRALKTGKTGSRRKVTILHRDLEIALDGERR